MTALSCQFFAREKRGLGIAAHYLPLRSLALPCDFLDSEKTTGPVEKGGCVFS